MYKARQESIAAVLLRQAISNPQKIALWLDSKSYTAAYIASQIVGFADSFEEKNLPTKTLILCAGNSAEFVAVFLGANLLGINVQVFNTDWPKRLRLEMREFLQADIFVGDADFCDFSDDLPVTDFVWQEKSNDEFHRWIGKADDYRTSESAFYTGFTSGSTGVPKGFMRTEQSWLNSFTLDEKLYHLNQNDSIICPGSFAHSLFLYALLRGIYAGTTVVAFSVFRAGEILSAIQNQKSVVLFAVPTQLQNLTDRIDYYPRAGENVRLVLSSGAKLQDRLGQSVKKSFSLADIAEFYGSSELGYISIALTSTAAPRHSVGRPMDSVDVRILDEKFCQCPENVPGRIYVRSPLQFLGYAGARGTVDLGKLTVHDGFIACGDTGYFDQQGFLYVSGRSDRMMIISARNCYPETIEAALVRHPGIVNVAVFALTDSLRGSRPIAIVAIDSQISVCRSEIVQFATDYLPDHEIPRIFYVQNRWPLTVSHKTDLQMLEQQLNQGVLEKLQ